MTLAEPGPTVIADRRTKHPVGATETPHSGDHDGPGGEPAGRRRRSPTRRDGRSGADDARVAVARRAEGGDDAAVGDDAVGALRGLRVLPRSGYGWIEFAAAAPCADEEVGAAEGG